MNLPLTARRSTQIVKAALGGIDTRSETIAPGSVRTILGLGVNADVEALGRKAAAALIQAGYEVARSGRTLTVTEPEPVEEAEEFVGEVEPTCPKCLYLSGHTSWCPESPLAGLDGEIRTDESGVARYWTAEEIRTLREVETAQRAEPAICAVDGQPLIRMSDGSWAHQASHLDGHPGHPAPGLTDADVRAIASGHPAGSIRRARLLS